MSAVTFKQLGLPDSAATFTIYLVIVGFPIAVFIAWFIELTPMGLVLDRDGTARRRRPALRRKYVSIVSALALASVAVFALQRYVGLPSGIAALDAALVDSRVDPNSIAVLPFANITGTEEGATLSLGLAEGIRNALGRVVRGRSGRPAAMNVFPCRDPRGTAFYACPTRRAPSDGLLH